MNNFRKIGLSIVVLVGLSWSAAFAQQKTPKDTDTASASRQSTCDGLNTALKASAAPLAPGTVVLITADLPWCDVRVEIPGMTISADPALAQAQTPTGTKPQGFARLHSVTLTSNQVTDENTGNTIVSTATDTILRNLWIDSSAGQFTPPPGPSMITVNSVDAVAINARPSFSDPTGTGNLVRDVPNGSASHASAGTVMENGFIFAGRNGIVALRAATGDGADRLTVQDMDIHVSDAESFSGDRLNRAAVLTVGANGMSIRRNLIVGDVSPPFPTETVGILVDDPLIGGGSSRDVTVESNRFTDLLAVGEFNNQRKGGFSRNDVSNSKHGIVIRDTDNAVDSAATDCANRTATDDSGDSTLWVVGQNNLDLQARNGFEVDGGCAHMFGNNVARAPNFGIGLRGSTSHSSIAGNSLSGTLVGVVLGGGTGFNDVIGRSGDIYQEVNTEGAGLTNTVTGKKVNTLPAGASMDVLDLRPDHS